MLKSDVGNLPEVGAEVRHNIGMATVLHHEDLLLYDAEVVPGLQLDHLDGSILPTGQPLCLRSLIDSKPIFFGQRQSRAANNITAND